MNQRKIQMIRVPEFNHPGVDKPICEKHSRTMIKKGRSIRGFPEFYCATSGHKIEKGISRVKVVFQDRGYGFISLPKGKDDLFFHFSKVSDHSGTLEQGDLVEFTVGINPKKEMLQALDVRKVNDGNGNNGRKK